MQIGGWIKSILQMQSSQTIPASFKRDSTTLRETRLQIADMGSSSEGPDPLQSFWYIKELAEKLVQKHKLDPNDVALKRWGLFKETIRRAGVKTKDPHTLMSYYLYRWMIRADNTVEDLISTFDDEEITATINRLSASKKWRTEKTKCGKIVALEITKLGGQLIAFCPTCEKPDRGSGNKWCFYKCLSSAGPSKQKKQKPKVAPPEPQNPGTIHRAVKSLLFPEKENELLLLHFSELRGYLYQHKILKHISYNRYISTESPMSDVDQARDYIQNEIPKRPKKEFYHKFLLCLYLAKEQPGHWDLLKCLLDMCNDKVQEGFLEFARKEGHPSLNDDLGRRQ